MITQVASAQVTTPPASADSQPACTQGSISVRSALRSIAIMAITISSASSPSRSRMVKAATKLAAAELRPCPNACAASPNSPSSASTWPCSVSASTPAARPERSRAIASSIRTISAWSRAASNGSTGSKPSR